MDKAQIAGDLFKEGYNCAQAVALAFKDELGIDEKTLLKLSSSFGGGMGRMREVCGAVSGMFMVAGVLFGTDDVGDNKKKAEHYALIQKLAAKFKEENGSIICRELLGVEGANTAPKPSERNEKYYKKRPCEMLVRDAARIILEELKERA